MYFKPNQFFHVDFDNLIPQIRKKIGEDLISLNRGNYFFFSNDLKIVNEMVIHQIHKYLSYKYLRFKN